MTARAACAGPVDDDLRDASVAHILAVCRALVGAAGVVLHGSPARPLLSRLEPRQANDAAKASGNRCAVYASTVAEVVLMHAVIDRSWLSSLLASYRLGYRQEAGRCVFRVSANVLELVRRGEPHLCTDGVVYALARAPFRHSPDDATEFSAPRPVVPLRRVQVPARVGWHLLRDHTVQSLETRATDAR